VAERNVGECIPHSRTKLHDYEYECGASLLQMKSSIEGSDDGEDVDNRRPCARGVEHRLELIHRTHEEEGAAEDEDRADGVELAERDSAYQEP